MSGAVPVLVERPAQLALVAAVVSTRGLLLRYDVIHDHCADTVSDHDTAPSLGE